MQTTQPESFLSQFLPPPRVHPLTCNICYSEQLRTAADVAGQKFEITFPQIALAVKFEINTIRLLIAVLRRSEKISKTREFLRRQLRLSRLFSKILDSYGDVVEISKF
mgnify:CR=1 FL=1